jgi:two-component system, OmpR family, sensor histidine kinase MtrB
VPRAPRPVPFPRLVHGAQRLLRHWYRSLQLRTVTATVVLTALAVLLVGGYIATSVSNDLFTNRRDQVLEDTARAEAAALRLSQASGATDRASLQALVTSIRTSIGDASSSTLIAFYRSPGQEVSSLAPQDFTSEGFDRSVISSALRKDVESGGAAQYWQSVTMRTDDGESPGIVVGSVVTLPIAGQYELYIGYDLADQERTLSFVQSSLLLAGVLLLVLVGAVAWIVVRFVVRPIREAALVSQQLADGQLDVRLPVHGTDALDTLAHSFNQMADSLQRQIRELADLSTVQQRFVSDVSHELRTPLTTIRLAGDVLHAQRARFDPAMARTAELLYTQVSRFELLLADLLEISRYDARSVDLVVEPTSMAALVRGVLDEMSSLAEAGGSVLTLTAPGGHTADEMDPRRVRRIIRNLLGNAIEHGEGRPIDITVDSSRTAVAVTVRDHGIGMDDPTAARVFDRFWRADPSRQRTIGGTGLGLAISQEDAAVHGGVIDLWSAPGLGTCFRLTLPRTLRGEAGVSPLPVAPNPAGDARDERDAS